MLMTTLSAFSKLSSQSTNVAVVITVVNEDTFLPLLAINRSIYKIN